jgi:2'-5' RNA ligase
MDPIRCFIAIEIPLTIQLAIRRSTANLQKELGRLVRWTPAENLHLTLKFLGDIPPTQADDLTRLLPAEAGITPAFDLHVQGFGSFPNFKMARILWVGTQAETGLDALYKGVESVCARLGFPPESRAFSPHLTIARVKQNASSDERNKIRQALESTKIDLLGTARVDSVHLVKSDLKPAGAVYTKLFSSPLKSLVVE